jgi:hypothetical protein
VYSFCSTVGRRKRPLADHGGNSGDLPDSSFESIVSAMTSALYYSPGSCSMAPHIVLNEIGQPFELRKFATADRANYSPEYLAVNPKGRIPALQIDGFILTEVPAILAYLGRVPVSIPPTPLKQRHVASNRLRGHRTRFTSRTRNCFVPRDAYRTSRATLPSRRADAATSSGASPTSKSDCSIRSSRSARGSLSSIRSGWSSSDGPHEAASTCEAGSLRIRLTRSACATAQAFNERWPLRKSPCGSETSQPRCGKNKTGPFGPVFRFLGSSLEIDRGVPCTAADELQIHQRQFDDFCFFFLNEFNEFNLCFDFQHLPSPESRNGSDSHLRPK